MEEVIRCRLAEENDVKKICQFVSEVIPIMQATGNFQWDYDYPTAEHFLKDIEDRVLWVAVCGDEVAGVIAITTDQCEEYKEAGFDISITAIVPHRMAVNPKYQGKGVAQLLFQQAEIVAKQQGINRLRVDTFVDNIAMNSVIEKKMGYKFVGRMVLLWRKSRDYNCYEKILD